MSHDHESRIRALEDAIAQQVAGAVAVHGGAMDAMQIISADRDAWKSRVADEQAATFRAKREAEDYRVLGKAQERELRDARATIVRLRLVVDLAAECADIHNDKSPYNCDEALYRAVRAYQQSSEHAKGDCE